jgi:hypothetical protein
MEVRKLTQWKFQLTEICETLQVKNS